jgi:phosphoribosylaminoimidazole (AIR) synthetase
MTDKYKEEVIAPGDRASQLAKDICFQSHGNCPAVIIVPHNPGNFRGAVGFAWKKHVLTNLANYSVKKSTKEIEWTMLEEVENDGAGGKPQFFTLVGAPNVFRGLGWEIICMVADDFARTGRMPCVIDNEISVKAITTKNYPHFEAMMQGYGAALKQANLVNITGEVAIMKHSITAFCDTGANDQLILTWGASCLGLAHKDKLIDGSQIRPDMPIVGFWEPGYRCNGGTFFTNLILRKFGPEIDKIQNSPQAMSFVNALTVPSQSYAKTICRILGWKPDGRVRKPLAQVKGIAHITGGGLSKLKEILPLGIVAHLDNMPDPAPVLRQAQEFSWGTDLQLFDEQAYTTLHGGCGMVLVCSNHASAAKVIREAANDGINAQIIGKTAGLAGETKKVCIRSRFKQGSMVVL